MSFGPIGYARRADVSLAFRESSGDGPDVVALMPGFLPLACIGDAFARPFFERLAGFGRVVLAVRRGVGESDPVDRTDPPDLDVVADDLLAVVDHAGMDSPAVFGFYNAGTVAVRLATRHPHRVSALALVQTMVSWLPGAGLQGVEAHFRERYAAEVQHGRDGPIDMLSIVAPSAAHDPEFRAWWDDVGRRGASPTSALAMTEADASWNVASELGAVRARTIVVHRASNRFVPVSHARHLAATIAGATLVEVPGDDHLGVVGDVDALLDPAEEFIAGRPPHRDRMLAAVLFTDLVDSTGQVVREGDRSWSRRLAEHDQLGREVVESHGGDLVKSTGDGLLALFPAATTAIGAARTIVARLTARGFGVRAGVHAGEVERLPGDVTGLAVTTAARVMDRAGAGEVLVSGVVPPLVAGSGLEFEALDEVELKGLPGSWVLLRVR